MKDDREQSKGEMPGGSGSSESTLPDAQPLSINDDEIVLDEGSRGWRVPPGTATANGEGGIPPGGEDEGSRGW